MERQALGLIETAGLIAAVEAADAAVKSADVILVGYELARGGGLVTVKVRGNVSAVQAAVSAGAAAAQAIGRVVSTHVIPRPHPDTDLMVPGHLPGERVAARQAEGSSGDEPDGADVDGGADGAVGEVCNLCHDPACPRRRGQPRRVCIHHQEQEES